nr:MAG TPA: hypothetical protein [Caudoviricetes sp.]
MKNLEGEVFYESIVVLRNHAPGCLILSYF